MPFPLIVLAAGLSAGRAVRAGRACVAQEAAQNVGWLAPGEMLDGLDLAETIPDPDHAVRGLSGHLPRRG